MKNAKLVGKSDLNKKSVVRLNERLSIGDRDILIIGGPCTVESQAQMDTIAQQLTGSIQALRGGVYKPRTSPYAFQGMGTNGIEILARTSRASGLPVVTEVMAIQQIETLANQVDMLQVGSRNMQNFDLLKALGEVDKPVLLKRGLAATIEEFIMAAEYIVSHGNPNVVLCERGIRSFDNYTRNVLDLGAVSALKHLTHLPVIVDPSHAAGRRELIGDLSRAAIACGADGLIIECHPEPDQSVSDAQQALSLPAMAQLVESLRPIATAVGRHLPLSPVQNPALMAA
ncbi:3-deoxy-7-phosphoheptulonate synthase [filamentous cyanobacterium LEGE 11480]|uniref:3-deoxy-7-phosphoheptulonate synthase n=1 Tax=Romeriopsis navalis LEGE 11480 TaxID=2777977 RepID=A0A928VRP6_9CYAN|nr:3-deoxy-7-phosphoheptulonate synthase [Romeriopsis navalis]MBE9030879.1 3-deoxy-7-phosphoheptulonate synthase [Romeriopsis navalis LEGE 11480]